MEEKTKDSLLTAACWLTLAAAFALTAFCALAGHADYEKSRKQLDSIQMQCDSLQRQIDYMVE